MHSEGGAFLGRLARVSVCMATYNGATYVGEQLRSILDELDDQDEVIVVDDASSDATVDVINALDDPRVRVHLQPRNRGYVRTFERAMGLATGDVVMLADQDDVWVAGRRKMLLDGLQHGHVVASNLVLLGDDAPLRSPLTGRPWELHAATSRQRVRNELRILAGAAPEAVVGGVALEGIVRQAAARHAASGTTPRHAQATAAKERGPSGWPAS